MKKYIISFLVVATFSVYAIYVRVISSSANVVNSAPSANIPNNNSPVSVPANNTPPINVPSPTPTPPPVKPTGQYKDGTYTGASSDAYYGNIQVKAVIAGGMITDVIFLDYPKDRNQSIYINTRAMPLLRSESIQAQSANINTISGATDSSGAFRQSLASALEQASN